MKIIDIVDHITNIKTGTYRNESRNQWEAWAFDNKNNKSTLLGCCSFTVG